MNSQDLSLTMPDLATTGSAVRVLRWLVKPGDTIKRGQAILEIETDKATMEVESIASGTVTGLQLKEGDEVEAGVLMATVRTVDVATSTLSKSATNLSATTSGAKPESDDDPTAIAPVRRGMFARNAELAAGGAPALSAAGRLAAQRLTLSKQSVPHFYLTVSANAEPILVCRKNSLVKPVWDAYFVRAVASSLVKFDRFACRFENDSLVRQESDAVGVAADIDGELYVVRVDGPREKTVDQISSEIRTAVENIRQDAPGARRARPGVFSISNLGSTGVESFCAIINPPEAAILAIGAVAPRVCVVDGEVKIQRCLSLTLSVDHRIANGKYAAEFLANVVKEIESP